MKRLFHRILHGHRFQPGPDRRGVAYVWADCTECGRTYIVGSLRPFIG